MDADQRTVILKVVGRGHGTVTVATPPNGNVAPPGPYMLFVNGKAADGSLVPSVAKQLYVTADAARADAGRDAQAPREVREPARVPGPCPQAAAPRLAGRS